MSLYLAPSQIHGFGVFTDREIPAGFRFHAAPLLILDPVDLELVRPTRLGAMLFQSGDGAGMLLSAMAMVNHSPAPNVDYRASDDQVAFWAIPDIAPGDELLIDYRDFATVLGLDRGKAGQTEGVSR